MVENLKKDLKLIINFKKIIMTTLGFAIIFFIFSTIFKGFMEEQRLIDQVHVGIVDQENTRLSRMLVGHFQNNEEFIQLFQITSDDEDTIKDLYNKNELSAIIYIPEDFTNSLLRFKNAPLQITLNANFPLQNTVLENIMSSYSTYIKAVDIGIYSLYSTLKEEGVEKSELDTINDNFSVNMVLTALSRNNYFEHEIIETFPSTSSSAYFIYSILLLMIIFVATSGTSLVSDELKNMCLQRYKTTGQSFLPFSLSKIFVMYLNIILILLPLLIGFVVFQNYLSIKYLALIILFLSLVILFFVNFSITIGLLFSKHEMSLLLSTLTTLTLGILGGHFIPIQIMPKFIQDISSFTPNYWMLRSCLYLNSGQIPKELLYTSTLLILVSIFFMFGQHVLFERGRLWKK